MDKPIAPPARFRVLIIGRANAGKTTILRAVCGVDEEPVVYDEKDQVLSMDKLSLMEEASNEPLPTPANSSHSSLRAVRDKLVNKWRNRVQVGESAPSLSSTPIPSPSTPASILTPSATRGLHNIEYSMIFPSNHRFVFHDSRGFESGTTEEVELVRKFIQARADKGKLGQQLHAIWYCFPTDSNRIITAAEQEFFKNIDTGNVPVIAVFTKFDSLDAASCTTLCDQGVPFEAARARAPDHAKELFNRSHLPLIQNQPHPPKAVVCLRNMHSSNLLHINEATEDLLESTRASLDDGVLMRLLSLVQHGNVKLCIRSAIEIGVITGYAQANHKRHGQAHPALLKGQVLFIEKIFTWFPYIHMYKETWGGFGKLDGENEDFDILHSNAEEEDHIAELHPYDRENLENASQKFLTYMATLPSSFALPLPLQILHMGTAAVLVAGNAYWLQDSKYEDGINASWRLYCDSGTAEKVRADIWKAFQHHTGPYNTLACQAKIKEIALCHYRAPE